MQQPYNEQLAQWWRNQLAGATGLAPTARSVVAVTAMNLRSWDDLRRALTDGRFLAHQNCGRKTVRALRHALAAYENQMGGCMRDVPTHRLLAELQRRGIDVTAPSSTALPMLEIWPYPGA